MYIVSLKNHMTSVVTGNIRVISNQIIVFAVLANHFPALTVHVHTCPYSPVNCYMFRQCIMLIKGVGPLCTLSL